MKYPPLTDMQRQVLACHALGRFTRDTMKIPNGVYRSLVIRGLLRPCRGGYEITAAGRREIEKMSVTKWSKL